MDWTRTSCSSACRCFDECCRKLAFARMVFQRRIQGCVVFGSVNILDREIVYQRADSPTVHRFRKHAALFGDAYDLCFCASRLRSLRKVCSEGRPGLSMVRHVCAKRSMLMRSSANTPLWASPQRVQRHRGHLDTFGRVRSFDLILVFEPDSVARA